MTPRRRWRRGTDAGAWRALDAVRAERPPRGGRSARKFKGRACAPPDRAVFVLVFRHWNSGLDGGAQPGERSERIDQMNMLDRNIGIVESKVDADVPDADRAALRATGPAPARSAVAAGLAVLGPAELLEPHPAHHLSQRHRPARAGHRDSLPLAVSRRPDRCAGAEPAGAGRDHRRRHRGVGDGGFRRHHHRPRTAAGAGARRELRPLRGVALRARFSDQSGAGRAGAAAPGVAHQYPRPHL